MAITDSGPAPYAPPATVITVMDGYRERGLTTPFTLDVLIKAGVSESLAPRTFQALKLLDLIDNEGRPMQQFDTLRLARGDEEYRERLGEWLVSTYEGPLRFIDLDKDDPDRMAEAFRGNTPSGQRSRMVTLMLGLFQYAGVLDHIPQRSSSASKKGSANGAPARRTATTTRTTTRSSTRRADGAADAGDLAPALLGLLRQIPSDGWTKDERAAFMRAFEAVLDFAVPTVTAASRSTATEDDP